MKKLLFLLMIVFLMSCLNVSALNISHSCSIALGETKEIVIPAPEGEIDLGSVYFQQEFLFTPENSGTYRFLMLYEEDQETPYEVFLDIPGPYRELENGIEFEATAGETYPLCFQYPNHDGRYPKITFFLGTPDMEFNPPTHDLQFLLPPVNLILALGLLSLCKKKYHTQ